jgi:hypothetical protein
MVYTKDLKSFGRKALRVQFPPCPPYFPLSTKLTSLREEVLCRDLEKIWWALLRLRPKQGQMEVLRQLSRKNIMGPEKKSFQGLIENSSCEFLRHTIYF